jgi:histidine triad (HIT) family protein
MNECIFCKIINKEIPATLLYEDEFALVFMDIGPIVEGHVLIIPKSHSEQLTDLSDPQVAHLHQLAKKVAKAQQSALQATGINILQNNGVAAGQEVPHFHIHVIPRFDDDTHHWNWNPKTYDSLDTMISIANKIKTHL